MFDLARLIHPTDVHTFARQHWERTPLIVQRSDPDYFHDLLTLADVDHILNTSSVHSTQIHAVRDGNPRSLDKAKLAASNIDAWYEEYRSGSTIVFHALHERSRALREMCRALAEEFSGGFQANVYLTPPEGQGFTTHYDTHDVFVVQAAGRKCWRVYEPTIELPLYGQPFERKSSAIGPVLHEVVLQAGDVMYLPRGYAHEAACLDVPSLHLAVGALTITWASVVLGAVEAAIEGDPEYRRSLPIGFVGDRRLQPRLENQLRDLSKRLLGSLDVRAAVLDAAERARQSLPVDMDGHLLDLESETRVTMATKFRTRTGVPARVEATGDAVSLCFRDKRVSVPPRLHTAVEFLARATHLRPADLPGELDEPGKLELVRRLLREGYLTIDR